MQFRQGDVFVESIHAEAPPEGARPVPRDRGRIVLAFGEATGHAHAIADGGANLYRVRDQATLWLEVSAAGGVRLVHEEHAPILLPAGWYIVRRQREYSPTAGSLGGFSLVADYRSGESSATI